MTVQPLNVLIVDDEIPLRQELRMFPWEECDAVLIGEASNGEEALHMCGTCAPDVVITDITMPVMDGITLIRELRKRYPAIQIILLTCHSDFHYVQEALRLGALEYILKVSMEEEELKHAMNKVRDAIVKERNIRANERAERRMLLAALFGKLLHGHEPNSTDWQPIPMDGNISHVWVRLILDAPNHAYLEARQRIQHMLSEMERTDPNWLIWLSIREKEYFVIIALPHSAAPAVQSLDGMIHALADTMKEQGRLTDPPVSVQAVVSYPFRNKEELALSLACSTEWKDALFYDSLTENHVFIGKPLPLMDITDKQTKEMNEMLRKASCSAASLKNCMQGDFVHWCVTHRIRPEQLKQRMLNWLVDWLMKAQEGAELDSSSVTQLTGAETLSRMVTCLNRDIAAAESGRTRSRIEIRSAIQWIKDHMQQPISLPVIAEQVGLSPHYVSRLFREETGSSVNEYITRLRMEKAVDLLKRTNKKVYEIAEEVGIPSYRYFTVTFRNWTGVSPTDYKRIFRGTRDRTRENG
ncbi:response regulator [Paenibacillus alkaliterrae]|uniref:response regulator n=1 Tax=Paenibacillus alkaliterrae TaxID=320909 RepID=UPI001F42170F|nr:response regulator [Paenibacillus alkaliterrae]MCF2937910.1 response regulator [Paenibacillus alkaliterrae]